MPTKRFQLRWAEKLGNQDFPYAIHTLLLFKDKVIMAVSDTKSFVERAISIHGDKYDYSKVNYSSTYFKVEIICLIHGSFFQAPKTHFKGSGCKLCGTLITQKKTTKSNFKFIEDAKSKFNNNFDYSSVVYNGVHSPIKILCPEHGEFIRTPNEFFKGHICAKCKNLPIRQKEIEEISKSIIEKATIRHSSKYTYPNLQYKSGKDKINVMCSNHGEFKIGIGIHVYSGKGCKQCWLDRHCWTHDEIIKAFSNKHSNRYNYSKTKFEHVRTKVIITCSEHGDFMQSPSQHLNGAGCPKCCDSKGETAINNYLNFNNINFIREYTFVDCHSIEGTRYKLRFDFYLPDYNMCIEFDGLQHYKRIKYWGLDKFDIIQRNDGIKNKYCKDNNIQLLRIRYNQINKVEEILSGIFN